MGLERGKKKVTLDELKELREQILDVALEPPWCENVEMAKKWIAGFEQAQTNILMIIDGKIKCADVQKG